MKYHNYPPLERTTGSGPHVICIRSLSGRHDEDVQSPMAILVIAVNPKPLQNPASLEVTKRDLIVKTASLCFVSQAIFLKQSFAQQPSSSSSSSSSTTSPAKPVFSGIANTNSWFQFYGDGFSIRVPPQFEDVMEPEDFNAGLSLYGDKAKPKTFAARFSSSDGSEVLSVVIRPTNQLKITFLEAQDITDLGSLKEASKIFIPGGATLYSARTIKIKADQGFRSYYFYEFGRYDQRVAMAVAVNSGKAIIAGASAPQSKWSDSGVKLRSAAISLSVT